MTGGGSGGGTGRRRNRLRWAIWGTAAGLLMVPAVAMQLGAEGWDWNAFDFVVMGALLAAASGTYELAAWMSGNRAYRAGVGVAVVAAFLMAWVSLAVGIIGPEDNPLNLMYVGVYAVGFIGALLARYRPRGMVRTLLATAAVQALIAVVAMVSALTGGYGWIEVLRQLVLNGFFVAMWLVSALLFHRAARNDA
ncbi:MAG: hypothetical protein A2579_10195 [Lysobacterales bacterium RIFOXYD1_FULL_69_11]|nr:MAG: hypothetical protein A2190_10300 [Xanthomonadales bacterium RIFOXYA1_FULL_69_10]OHE88195.1 MAG: hypothetical protein A2579_10195 [Xanthomonadales bacterium RIFOXYD1_FULL_69_11]